MEGQIHRTYDRDYDDLLYPAGSVVHKDEADTVNDSAVVRSGMAEPTVMGTPVLAEDMYDAHSDIVDLPVRSFAQWEDEERHHSPPPMSTNYETHLTDLPHMYGGDVNREPMKGNFGNPTDFGEETGYGTYETHLSEPTHVGRYTYGQDVNMEPLEGRIGNSAGLDEEGRYSSGVYVTHPGGDHVYANEGEKDIGITGVLHSLDKMKVFDEHDNKPLESDKPEPKVYTGTHDQFSPEPVNNPPLDTIAANPSNPNSSYAQKISSATSAITEKASAVKDSIVSNLTSSGQKKSDAKTNTKSSSFPTVFSHKVADTLSSTLGPVYEKVTSKMHGSGDDETAGSPRKGVTVKEYLVDTFKPGDDDKVLSEAITHAFHRGKGNQLTQETTTTTTYVVKEEGERRLQDSGN